MGYTTTFDGRAESDKEFSEELIAEINAFCEKRQCSEQDYNRAVGPSLWCDWCASNEDGKGGLQWNGSEKSYSMEQWLPILIEKFIKPAGHTLNGFIQAYGEEPGDVWGIKVENNVVNQQTATISFS